MLAMNKYALVVALKLGRNSADRVCISSLAFSRNDALLKFELTGHLQIEPSLLHDHIKTGEVFVAEVKTRLGHVCIDHFLEDLHICGGIALHTIDKAAITISTIRKITGKVSMLKLAYFVR